MTAVRWCGVDRERVAGARQGDEAGAGAQRGAGGETGGAGPGHRPGDDDRVAAAVLVVLRIRRPEQGRPERRAVLEGARRQRGDDGVGDADVGDGQAPAERPPRIEQVRGLLAEEGDGRGGMYHGPERRAGVGGEAARQVDGEDRGWPGVDGIHDRAGRTRDRPVEAGAEERVDDQRSLGQRRGRRMRGAGPAVEGDGGVALQTARVAEQRHRHGAPGRHQPARRDEAVAAVVAGAGDDEDRAVRHERRRGVGDRAAGGLHQRHAGRAGGDRAAVGLGHLGGGEELVHGFSVGRAPAGCAGIRRCCRGRRCRRAGRRG